MRQTGLRESIVVIILRLVSIIPSIVHIVVWIWFSVSLESVLSTILVSFLLHEGILAIRLSPISLLSQLFMDGISLSKLFLHLLSSAELI